MPSDLRTRAIVLRRTNYGEADRILKLLTPEGMVAVLARGVRKEKSRLAGGVELFSVADVVVHHGKSPLGTLTSAKMLQFFSRVLSDVQALELAASMMKQVERATEQVSSPEYFSLLVQGLDGLDRQLDLALVQTWFSINLSRIGGEEINLLRDVSGDELYPDLNYLWDSQEKALRADINGKIQAREIKFARLLQSKPLLYASKIADYDQILPRISPMVTK